MLPNFLIIGAMKAGTTSLHAYLGAHPEVFVSRDKELHFFSGITWDRGLDWYAQQFAGAEGALAVGESSPSYSQASAYPGVPGRIAATLPGVRLVYVVRHPIERLRSMYLHQLVVGEERRPIVEALAASDAYLDTSLYARQIDEHLQHVPRDRLLVVTAEGLRDRREATYARVLRFLDVDDTFRPTVLGVERNSTARRQVRTDLGAWLDRRRVVRSLPARPRRWLAEATSRAVDPSAADLPPAVLGDLEERLRPDVARLAGFVDDPEFDGWGLL